MASEVVRGSRAGVGWPVASGATVRGCGAVEHALFESRDRRGGRRGWSVPAHGRAIARSSAVSTPALSSIIAAVWRSVCIVTRFARSVGHVRRADGDVLGKTPLERVAGERSAGARWEQRVGGLSLALAHPDREDGDGLAGERGDALLAAFAERLQVGAGAELHVGVGQPQSARRRAGRSARRRAAARGRGGRPRWCGPGSRAVP